MKTKKKDVRLLVKRILCGPVAPFDELPFLHIRPTTSCFLFNELTNELSESQARRNKKRRLQRRLKAHIA